MQTCNTDSDCGRLNYCDLDLNECVHEDIFPVKGLDIAAYIVMGIFLGLQNIGGLGAGTIKIFVFMIILNYSMSESTSLTYAVLFGSKLADNLMAYKRKHPIFKEKPLIDYSITLIFLPSVLLGSVMGAAFSPILPNIVLQICLFIFISISLVKTLQKVKKQIQLRKQEKLKNQQETKQNNEEQKIQNNENKINNNENNEEIQNNSKTEVASVQCQNQQQNPIQEITNKEPKQVESFTETQAENQQQQQNNHTNLKVSPSELDLKKYKDLLESEKKIPLGKLLFIFIIFIILFVFYMILGGKKADSIVGLEMCSDGYWVLYAFQFLIYIGFFIGIKKYLMRNENIKAAGNHIYQLYETSISKLGMSKFIINGFACGFIIGLVGFGGSLTIVPIMLVLGLHPRAATATTSFLTIFSSAISVITALLGGQLSLEEFGFMFAISFVGSTIFTYIFNKIVEYFKLESLTIAFTAVVQFALLSAVIILFIISLINQPFSDQLETKDFC